MKNKMTFMKKNLPSIYCLKWVAVMVALVALQGAQAGIVAAWDFEEAIDGQYGVESITQSVSSVNSLIAVEGSGNPLYVRGADGVGHGTGAGILKVASNDALLTGFTEFNISFDARLHAAPTATQCLLRYGVTTTAWNIYTTTDSSIRIEVYDASGTKYTASAGSSAMHPGDGQYHHYEFVWGGTNLSIIVDGTEKASETWDFSAIRSTAGAGNLGIGGLVREAETTSQEFNGFIDNVVINNTSGLTPPALAMTSVASWDFNGGSVGADIISATDSISGLTAVTNINNGAAKPQYVVGNGGDTAAGFGGVNGVLQADDPSGILGADFTALKVTFDVDLAADLMSGDTLVLLRNGHLDENFNIFMQSNNVIGVIMKDADGVTSSGSIRTSGSALSATVGWQTVSVVWDGEAIWILVDGVAQPLVSGGLFATVPLVSLLQADAPLGIGGLVRNTGTTGQYLDGSLDNILIEGIFVTPPLVSISDVAIEIVGGTNAVFSWMGNSIATYTLQYKTNLVSGIWSNLVENIPGVDATMSVTNDLSEPHAFFRTIAQ